MKGLREALHDNIPPNKEARMYPLNGQIPEGTVPVPSSELDTRTEEELMQSFRTFQPATDDEKNVWAYWHAGFDSMPPWTQRNVVNWARRLGPKWTVRVLDGVKGSPNNATHFVPSNLLPMAMREERMDGPYAATHSADFVRLPLLLLYGGCWLDVGAILLGSLEDIWQTLVDPEQPYEFAAFTFETRPGETSIINTWMMSRKGCEMVRRWHETFVHVWGDATRCDGLHRHPLLRHLAPYDSPSDGLIMKEEEHEALAKSNGIMDYGAQVHCLERLRDLVDKDDGWNGRQWLDTKTYLLPVFSEMWLYQKRTAFLGYKQFELLTTPIDAPQPQSGQAGLFVDDMLANTLLMKFCHGLKGAMASSLADIWDDLENDGTDCLPGTFAEYLRWGSVHLRQTRTLVPEKLTPARQDPHVVGMFEPFP